MRMVPFRSLPCLVLALAGASCSVLEVDTRSGPPRVVSDGIVDGHIALGVPDQDRFLSVDLFDGRSSGAVAEVALWKLFRVEVGLAGASVGVGPFELGLGVLAYNPVLTRKRFESDEQEEVAGCGDDEGRTVHTRVEVHVGDKKRREIDEDPYEPEFD